MGGKVQYFVDLGSKDAVPHVFFGLTNSAGLTSYYGYAPVTTAPVKAGKIFTGLTDTGNGTAGHMDQVSYSSPQVDISDAQFSAMQLRIDQWSNNPGTYIVIGHNCATFVQDVYTAAQVPLPVTGTGLGLFAHPVNFIPWTDKPQFFNDAFGNPATGGNLNDKAKNPELYPDTPAYQFIHSGGASAPVSNPATSESIVTNSDGSITLTAKFQDGKSEYETTLGGELHDLFYATNGTKLSDQYADVYSNGTLQSCTIGTPYTNGNTQVTSGGYDSAGVQKMGAVVIVGNAVLTTQSSFGTSLINDAASGFAETVKAQLASFGIGINSKGVVYQVPRGMITSVPVPMSADAISASASASKAPHTGIGAALTSMLEHAHGTAGNLGHARALPIAVESRSANPLPADTRRATPEGQVHQLLSAMAAFHAEAAGSAHFVPSVQGREQLLAASHH